MNSDKGRPEGHFALQMHAENPMHVLFKNIEILDEGKWPPARKKRGGPLRAAKRAVVRVYFRPGVPGDGFLPA